MGVHHTLFLPVIQAGGEYEALQDLKKVINLKLFLISVKKKKTIVRLLGNFMRERTLVAVESDYNQNLPTTSCKGFEFA